MKYVFFSMIYLFSLSSYSQIPVGLLFDAHGKQMNIDYDVFTYQPSNAIISQKGGSSFEEGIYYSSDGKKETRRMKAEETTVYCFKEPNASSTHKIKPIPQTSLKIKEDSFLVITNYYRNNNYRTKPIFVKHLYENEKYSFAKYYYSINQEYKYLANRKGSKYWKEISLEKNEFKSKAPIYFSSFPKLKDRITEGKYSKNDLENLIKMLEYYALSTTKDSIVFDKYWNPTSKKDSIKYYGLVKSLDDFKWRIDYYKNDTLMFRGTYKTLVPLKKDAEFVSYHSNGSPKVKQVYKKNALKTTTIFHSNGHKYFSFYYYDQISYEESYNGDLTPIKIKHCKYEYLNDLNGNNLLSDKDTNNIEIHDDASGFTFYQTYVNNELQTSYRVHNNTKIYSIVNPDYIVDLTPIRDNIFPYRMKSDFSNAYKDNAHGNILIHLQVDEKGYVTTFNLLNTLHPEYATFVTSFLTDLLLGEKPKEKLKPFKIEKEKVAYEFILPVTFMLSKIEYQDNYFYWYDFHMQQHMNYQIRECQYDNIYSPPTYNCPMQPPNY